ncbi:MAG: PAS domain S-box protein [Gallionella sp.]
MINTSGEHHPKRILKYVAALLVLALLADAAFLISRSWREAKADQASQLTTIADLDETAIDMYFTQLEIGMQSLGADLGYTLEKDKRNKPDLDRAYTLVSRFQKLHNELGNVILMRGDGQVLLTGTIRNSRDLPTLAKDLAFMDIRGELQQGRAFVIGKPVMGRIDKSWVVAARYAVAGKDGKLAYILSANLPANLLLRYRPESASPRISALGLVRDDGYLVSRYPEPDAAMLDDMYGKPAGGAMIEYLRANNYPQRGQVEMPGRDGKATALREIRRLQHYPVTLFVEMQMSEIGAARWRKMHAPYVLMALLLAGTFVFYGMSLRSRRAWSTEKRREELRHNYEKALNERSPNEIFMFDADTLQISYANDYALDNLGYTMEQLRKKDMLSLHPEMGIESFGALIEPLRRGEQEAVRYQTLQARRNGSTYPVEVNLQLMKTDAGGEGFMAIVNDISALKLAEENIRKFNAPVERRAANRK